MLHLHLRRHVERLADDLADVVRRPLRNPFAQECIVVQSVGMQRWLEMALATRTGVWANGWFPFPEAFARKLRRDVLDERSDAPDERPLDRGSLAWAIAAAIAADAEAPTFAPLRAYLRHDDTSGRLIGLAGRIAEVFDGYQLHRPDMLLGWEAGLGVVDDPDDPDDAWQPALWRAAVARLPERVHAARRAGRIIDALDGGRAPRDPDFERVSVFGLSTISPLYLRILRALAVHVDVNVFALAASPTDARVVHRHAAVGRMDNLRAPDADAATDMPPAIHPLLGSMAGVAREFQLLAGAAADRVSIEGDAAGAAGVDVVTQGDATQADAALGDVAQQGGAALGDAAETRPVVSALLALQSDLAADHVAARPGALARLRAGQDASVSIHACHGPLREVEVLRDQLLRAFDDDPTLEPHDIVVMTPDIGTYAPYVEAVFGATRVDGCRLPFAVADRAARDALAVVQAFGRLLHVLRGRFTAPEVVDLLALPPIRARFALDAADVDAIREWVAATGIRWAADAEHRRAVAQPPETANTWRFGLDRLLVGYAVGDDVADAGTDDDGIDDDGCCLGVLPAVDALGAPARLGALDAFVRRLAEARAQSVAPRPAAAWAADLAALLAAFVAEDAANAWQHQRLRDALTDLAVRVADVDFAGDLSLDCVSDQILGLADEDDAARGFLAGGITVCALQPMRSIPFRVVALLGMNDGAFPRPNRPFAFDLVLRAPRLGDRRARDDDRFLFLEALLAARERLIVTFGGQSERDNSRRPPSVVVSELLDALLALEPPSGAGQGDRPADAATEGVERARPITTVDDLIVWHPLQPFSPRYFAQRSDGAGRSGETDGADPPVADARVFSYANAYVDSATRLRNGGDRTPRAAFLRVPLAPVDACQPRLIALHDLCAFVRSPATFFLRRRLDLSFAEDDAPLEDREPLVLGGLANYTVGQAVLLDRLAGHGPAAAAARVRARGIVPLGAPGAVLLDALLAQAEAIATAAAPWLTEPPLPPHPIDVALPAAGARLVGTLRGVRPPGLVRCSFARVRPAKELDLWVEHLVLNAILTEGADRAFDAVAPISRRIGRPGDSGKDDRGAANVRYDPVADPLAMLSALATLYLAGETRWVPLLPATSYAFAAVAGAIDAAEGGGDGGADGGARDDRAALERKAWREARHAYEPPRHRDGAPGEGEDPAIRLLVGDLDPFGDEGAAWRAEFAAVAHAVFDPLLAVRVEGYGGDDGRDASDAPGGPRGGGAA